MKCLDENVFLDLANRQLSRQQLSEIDQHLDGCSTCREVASQLARTFSCDSDGGAAADQLVAEWKEIVSEVEWTGPFAPGTRIDRYIVGLRLGMGGMGVVYAAFDPELNRKVAIKLLRASPSRRDGLEDGELGERSLLREAQAMARLSHPNVVSVYDVGVHDGRVFVAMEFVEGETLRSWLSGGLRSWQEIVRIFIRAGRGLEAAHAAGLVHRDFKPDNVLIGADGRVLVTDFGLARSGGALLPSADRASLPQVLRYQSDAIAGTLAYMAPAQRRGELANVLSDQFSFCASLYESLTGTRPINGATATGEDRRATAVPPAARLPLFKINPSALPHKLRALLMRGLEPGEEARFPSMDPLLAALEHAVAPSSRRTAQAIAAACCVAIVALGAVGVHERRRSLCKGAESKLEGIWDGRRK